MRKSAMAAVAAAALGAGAGAGGAPAAAPAGGGCGDVLDPARSSPEQVAGDPTSIALGDFDRDGLQDLAVGDRRGVAVLPGLGRGDFGPARRVSLPTENRRTVVAGRFDADALADVALVDTAGPRLSVLLGDGLGGFRRPPAAPPALPPLPLGAQVADFDGDGAKDLLVGTGLGTAVGAPRPGRGELAVLLGDGAGGFSLAPGSPVRIGTEMWTAVGDFDEDGRPDVAAPGRDGTGVAVHRGDGRGGLVAGPVTDMDGSVTWIATARFDRDDHLDLAVVAGGNTAVLLGDGRGRFRAARGGRMTTAAPTQALPADFNGDGRTDVAVTGLYRGEVTVGLGDGSGRLHPLPGAVEVAGRYVYPGTVTVGDVNRDERPDLAIANPRHAGGRRVTVMLGTGARVRPGATFRPALAAAPAAERVTFGARVVLSATLTCGDRPLGLQALELQRREVRGGRLGAWRRVAVAGTNERGAARRRPRPRVNGEYRWHSAAGPGLRAVSSGRVPVRVEPRVSLRVAGGTGLAGSEFVLSGGVWPAHRGALVYLQRRVGDGWRSLERMELTERSRFRFTARPSGAGYRVLLPAHADHATGRSPIVKARARPAG